MLQVSRTEREGEGKEDGEKTSEGDRQMEKEGENAGVAEGI